MNLLHKILIFCFQLFAFQTCQRAQTHVYDSLCLHIIQGKTLHQSLLCLLGGTGAPDNPNYFVNIVKGNQQTL